MHKIGTVVNFCRSSRPYTEVKGEGGGGAAIPARGVSCKFSTKLSHHPHIT